MAKQILFQISDQDWSGGIMPNFLKGGKYEGPSYPRGYKGVWGVFKYKILEAMYP